MEFGVYIVTYSDFANPDEFATLASAAEQSGFDAVHVGDHVAFQREMVPPDELPIEISLSAPFQVSYPAFDVFQVLAHLSASTDSITLGTNCAIPPYRHPVVLTKHVLTLSALSGGRIEFGVAPGYLPTEFESLGVPFEERGRRTDEFLRIFSRACETAEFEFDGEFHAFPETGFYPRPRSVDGPDVLIGGLSGAAFRRIAEFGDGWTFLPESPEQVQQAKERIVNAWDDYDRDDEPTITIGLWAPSIGYNDGNIVGSVDDFLDELRAYRDVGVDRVFIVPQLLVPSADQYEPFLEAFSSEINARF